MELEELFRKKLENSEVTPGVSVRTKLMRNLVRKEFLRFNPARFNIYYLGGITAAIVATAIFTVSFKQGETKPEILPESPKTELTRPAGTVLAPTETTVTQQKTTVTGSTEIRQVGQGAGAGTVKKSVITAVSGQAISPDSNSEENQLRPATPEKSPVRLDKLSGTSNPEFQLQKKTSASFSASVVSGCIPLKVKFMNQSSEWDSCRWVFGDGGYSCERDPEWLFDVPGEYRVILKVFGSGGAESSVTQMLNVYPRPSARFEFEPQEPIIPDDRIRFVNYSADAVRYRWEFGDGSTSDAFDPEHKYIRYKSYNVRLIVWSEHGCTDSLLLTDAFAASGCYIRFPNAFIPNTDGPSGGNYSVKSDEAAQIFHPVTSGVSEFQMRIFSKKGILIFESNDINTGWDGYHKGQLCETGVYIWKVRGTYKNGEPFVKMGDVTLLKN